MTRTIRFLAAVGFAAALLPATGAHAEPFTCNGSPDIPETYVCIERFTVGVDPVIEPISVESEGSSYSTPGSANVPSKTVGVDPMVFTVPAQPVHIPEVCAVVCFGPFDTTTPPVTQTTPDIHRSTPAINQPLPQTTVDTPPVAFTLPAPFVSLYPEPVLVLSYLNECYYVYPSGRIRQADMVAGECP